jgi:glycosyltransferase involved in cell wall biosynthesis
MSDPKLSVVIPCFNAAMFIEDALESVLSQTYGRFEIIVVDGGSTDNTLDLLRNYASFIKKIISEPDSGVPDALNKGFSHADGDIFCWLNADDVYVNPSAFALAVQAFRTPNTQFTYGHSANLDEKGFVTRKSYTWSATKRQHQIGANIFTGSMFFSRSSWERFGGFNIAFTISFEHELIDHLLDEDKPVLIDQHIAALRVHPNTLTNRNKHIIHRQKRKIRGVISPQDATDLLRRLMMMREQGILWKALINKVLPRDQGVYWRDFAPRSNAWSSEKRPQV